MGIGGVSYNIMQATPLYANDKTNMVMECVANTKPHPLYANECIYGGGGRGN